MEKKKKKNNTGELEFVSDCKAFQLSSRTMMIICAHVLCNIIMIYVTICVITSTFVKLNFREIIESYLSLFLIK